MIPVKAWWVASIAKRGWPATVRIVLAAVLVAALLALMGWGLLSGKWYAWRAEVWKDRAVAAAKVAETAQREAKSSDQGAANATHTRQAMDEITITVRTEAEQSAHRIETHVPSSPAADRVDADILRELEAGDDTYRAAADRLQRARRR